MLSCRRIGPLSSGIALTLPSLRAFSIARHGTNPTPRPASTAAMIPSVEFMSMHVRSCCRKTPFCSRYSSTNWRMPDPTSRKQDWLLHQFRSFQKRFLRPAVIGLHDERQLVLPK